MCSSDLEDVLDDADDAAESADMAEDEELAEATRIVRMENKASPALLQRRMNIGYAKAARILDALEELGVVGPYNGSEPREVLAADEPDDIEEGADNE